MKPLRLFASLCCLLLPLHAQPSLPTQQLVQQLTQAPDQATRLAHLEKNRALVNCELAQALNAEGDRLFRERQDETAIALSQLAAAAAKQCTTLKETASAINNIGRSYYQMGKYELAIEPFKQSLAMRRNLPDELALSQSLNNMAALYQAKGSYNLVLNFYEQSQTIKLRLALKNQTNNDFKNSVALGYGNIGTCYRFLGNYPFALEKYRQGIKLYEESNNLNGLAIFYNYSGDTLTEQGQLAQALEQFNQSLAYNQKSPKPSRELQAQILNNIGLAHYLNKNYELALAACRESLRLREEEKNPERIARTQRRLAMIYLAQNDLTEALKQAQASAQLSKQHTETFWQARLVEGEVHSALKNPAAAAQCFAEAIQTIEEMRTQAPRAPDIQQRFFENKITPYLAMTKLLIAAKRHQEALAYAERTKARVILDLIQTTQTLAQDNEQLSPLLASTPLTAAEIAALVPTAETILLEFVIFNEKVHLFALTKANAQAPAELQTIPLEISATKLTELVQTFRREVAERKISFAASAQALYQHLLKPAAGLLSQKKNVVIVPDGVLWELPFQALMPAEKHYLWQDHTIFYAPSLTALREITKRHADRKPTNAAMTLLALGNPTLTPNAQSEPAPAALTYAERQVQQLRQVYGLNASKVLTGAAATETAFKAEASKYSVLHLATHGIYDNLNPMSSRVLLAASASEDGKVEAQEIINLKLTNELIVLSACETGRGHIGPGEGVIGLTWAFLIAGCPTLVASQWEVRDDSTSRLMINFHRALKNTQQPRAEALRQAALSLLKSPDYNHPYYWAGFVLIGDGY